MIGEELHKTSCNNPGADIEVSGPGGIGARARNLRKLDYAITVILCVFGFMFWEHMHDSREMMVQQIKSNAEVAGAIRYFACIALIDPAKRMDEMRDQHGLCTKVGKP